MLIRFTKMHGLGNDFMLIDCISQSLHISSEKIRQWSDRYRGIGFDQLLLVEPPTDPDADFYYRIFNANGSESSQCGNGARCFARFVHEKKLSHKETITLQTGKGLMEATLNANDDVTVNMAPPIFDATCIPAAIEIPHTFCQTQSFTLRDGQRIEAAVLSMGNPHVVFCFPEINNEARSFWESTLIGRIGEELQQHPAFPESCNVGFFEVISRQEVNVRVLERGAGETLSCGSGACASMVAARMKGWVDETVKMHVRGGTLEISWSGSEDTPVYMKGSATKVFEGQIRV